MRSESAESEKIETNASRRAERATRQREAGERDTVGAGIVFAFADAISAWRNNCCPCAIKVCQISFSRLNSRFCLPLLLQPVMTTVLSARKSCDYYRHVYLHNRVISERKNYLFCPIKIPQLSTSVMFLQKIMLVVIQA